MKHRAPAFALAALLATGGCQGGQYGGLSNGKGTDCGMVNESLTREGGRIVGTATTACQTAPKTHLFTIQLTLTSGGANPLSGVMASAQSNQIPGAAGLTLTVRHTCFAGTWVLKISAAGRSSDGTPFDYSDSKTLAGVTTSDCFNYPH